MQNLMKKRALAIFTAAALILSAAGCNQGGGAASEPPEVQEDGAVDLTGTSFTIWSPIYWTGKVAGFADNEAWQEMQERLGVTLTFQQPPAGQEVDQFNLMIAGDDLPDMISTGWVEDGLFVGGLDKYIDDGVIVPLNDLIEDYAPDYKKALETVVLPEERKNFYTDEGNLCGFYAISPYEEWCYNGLLYRQDWMDELGLENPKTFAEVENVLTQFRDQKGAKNPLCFPSNGIDGFSGMFLHAWDVGPGFYNDNGTVKYGPIQPGFKEYLTLMHDWYEKGLIDQDFATRDEESLKRLMTSGESGAVIHSADTVGAWMEGISTMMGGNYVSEDGTKEIQYRLKTYQKRPPFGFFITSACESPEAAAAFLNYGYTEEGYMLANYGIEGETYELTGDVYTYNGIDYPAIEYTDKMLNNPDYPVLDAIAKFKMHIGPFIRFEHEGNPAMNMTNAGIRQAWTEGAGTDLVLPPVTLTAEEGKEAARIQNQTSTYQDTAVLEFIMGKRDLSEFDQYVADMQQLGIDQVTAYYQAALERYNSRPS